MRVGQVLDVQGDSLVILSGGGNLRMARATAIVVDSEDAISLEHGELYVDIPPGASANDVFRV